jgi:hypothetical protein
MKQKGSFQSTKGINNRLNPNQEITKDPNKEKRGRKRNKNRSQAGSAVLAGGVLDLAGRVSYA